MRLIVITFFWSFLLFTLSISTHAASPAKLDHFGKPAAPQGVEGGFWRVDHYFDSVLHIKNVLSITSITVTPALFMADGTEYDLAPIEIDPSGIAFVSINHALSEAPASIRSHLSDFGTVAVRFNWSWPTAVLANIQNIDEINSLSFTNNLRADQNVVHAPPSDTIQSLEGLWWRATASSEPFVSLTNVSFRTIRPTITVSNSGGLKATQKLTIGAHNTSLIALRNLLSQLPSNTTEGGIEISYKGKDDALTATAGIEDFTNGYSANIPLYPSATERNAKNAVAVSQVDYLSPGLMVGLPDAKMQFPDGTKFKPYAVMRNTTSSALTVNLLANYFDGAEAKQSDIGIITLVPNGVQQVDVEGLLAKANFAGHNGELNLKFSFKGKPGDLIFVTGSADQSKNYVFEVNPTAAGKIPGRIFCFWKVHGNTDTMLSFWNYTDKDEDSTLILYFRGGQYKIPVFLKHGESREVNIAAYIREQLPDRDGNAIPQNIEEGSAVLRQTADEQGDLEIAAAISTFNVVTATCSVSCATCRGLVSLDLDPNLLSATIGANTSTLAMATYNDGTQSDRTTSSTWSSGNTVVATASTGMATGIGQGQTNIQANAHLAEGIYWCDGLASCPFLTFSGVGPIQVYTLTQPQHTYPGNPFPQACWISQLFDHVTPSGKPHHAVDVTNSNGNNTHGEPALGATVSAMEAGTVTKVDGSQTAASPAYPNCLGALANTVWIKGSDGYTTRYVHITPMPGLKVNDPVAQGQVIGTIDESGCQKGRHLHVGRYPTAGGAAVNFTIPCDNQNTNQLWDGTVSDEDFAITP